jgi:hypothetical protein
MSTPTAQTVTSPWAAHRRRGEALAECYPHARQVLTLYLALLDGWEQAWRQARASRPAPQALASWAAEQVAPRMVAITVQSGPAPLAVAVSEIGPVEPLLRGWLAGAEPEPVERYLARVVLRGPLEAVDAAAACAEDPAPRGGRHCPTCGGRPQLSFRTNPDDALVSGRRCLSCVRCGTSWAYAGNTCAWCGETSGARRTVFAEHRDGPVVGRGGAEEVRWHRRPKPGKRNGAAVPLASRWAQAQEPRERQPERDTQPLFPHLRIETCEACAKYVIDVDLGIEPRAVPEVDELVALPLDLFAAERGLAKVTPNLMGF